MRLIDADALMGKLRRQPMFEKTDFDKKMLYVEKSIIDDMPTIEAEPVVHGRWIDDTTCSNCGHFDEDERGILISRHNYCPNCGAKMDLEVNTND